MSSRGRGGYSEPELSPNGQFTSKDVGWQLHIYFQNGKSICMSTRPAHLIF